MSTLYERYKNIIKAMPNFDKEIFEDVTGIKISSTRQQHEQDQ